MDAKYPHVSIGDGTEPIFLIRAQDCAALPTLERYLVTCVASGSPSSHLTEVEEQIRRFEAWQAEHPDRVKVPD